MKLEKRIRVDGEWLKPKQLTDGSIMRLTDAAWSHPSQFTNDNGTPKTQIVAHCTIDGLTSTKPLIVRLNTPTVEGLIDAFGEETEDWINEPLTVHLEKSIINGKRATALYLFPPGYELTEDEQNFMHVTRIGQTPVAAAPPVDAE